MKILLNFVPLKSGGGVQVGLDFLRQLKENGGEHDWYLVATRGTPFAEIVGSSNLRLVHIVPRNLVQRIWFEYVGCRRLIKTIAPDVIYTQFGPHWPGGHECVNIVGCAYSNLFYPEIDFWGSLPIHKRFVKAIIDKSRLSRIRKADKVIFETLDLAARAEAQGVVKGGQAKVVIPTVSSLVTLERFHDPTRSRCAGLPMGFRILLLSTYNRNKNIELLPYVAEKLRNSGACPGLKFIITLPENTSNTLKVLALARQLGVAEDIINFGTVPYEGCAELYRACDAVILPAQLESFSNTIAEAWNMQRPLIISDFDWSRSICGNAALYVRYRDASDTACQIEKLFRDHRLRSELVANGTDRLKMFPSAQQRFLAYLRLVEER